MKHLLLILSLALTACSPAMNSFIAAKKEDTVDKKKDDANAADGEKVDIPSNISGSYLACSLRKDASATDPSSEYGCRLNEANTNNKLDLSRYEARIAWKSNLSSGVSIDAKPLNSVWHALYRLTASDLAAVRDLAARLEIEVQWNGTDGKAVTTFQDSKVIDVLQPADAAGDTSAPILQGQGIDPTDPGTL